MLDSLFESFCSWLALIVNLFTFPRHTIVGCLSVPATLNLDRFAKCGGEHANPTQGSPEPGFYSQTLELRVEYMLTTWSPRHPALQQPFQKYCVLLLGPEDVFAVALEGLTLEQRGDMPYAASYSPAAHHAHPLLLSCSSIAVEPEQFADA